MIQSTDHFFQEVRAAQEVRKARDQENLERSELRQKAWDEYYGPSKTSPTVIILSILTIITLTLFIRSKFRGVHSNKLQD